MVALKQKRPGGLHKKRRGEHHRISKQYHKVYWPYVPIIAIVALGLYVGNLRPQTRHGVLAYATNMSITTLLDSTNSQRHTDGKADLKINPQLAAAAQAKANDMTAKNYWSHNTPSGQEPWVFVQNANYHYLKAGENLAYGFNSSKETINGWMNSPTHRANLLDPAYTEVGFGFANAKDFNHSGPETVVVAMYGEPSSATAVAGASEQGGAQQSNAPVNSTTPLIKEPQSFAVARIHALTSAPWALFAIGIASGLIAAFVFIKHGLAFKKLVVEGEEFIIHHPVLDIILVTVVMTGYVLSQGVGVIR